MGVSDWIWWTFLPWRFDRVMTSSPRTFLPRRLTVWVLTTRISLFLVSQCPDLKSRRTAPSMGISKFLKDLYFGEHLSGVIQMEILHCWRISSACSLLMKFLGVTVSAIFVSLDVVWIQISSFSFGEYLAGLTFAYCIGFTKLTMFQLSKISWI